MRTIWIVVADAGRAQILSKGEGTDSLETVEHIENAAGRARDVDLVTDHPGRIEKHAAGSRSTMDAPTDPHEQEARNFAHRLNVRLESAEAQHVYDLLVLVAAPHFLGLLKSGLGKGPQRRLVASIPKDLTRLSNSELQVHLADVLQFPYADVPG
jgi:protein required for attachment to host cells